jgi:signal transduction histidine kinase
MGQRDLGQIQSARASVVGDSRRAWITAVAVAIAVLAMAAAVLTLVLVVANRAHLHGVADFDLEDIIVPFSFGAVGALVASRQPRNVIGWLFLSIAVISALQALSDQYARYGFVTHPGSPAAVWALWLDSWVISAVFPCGALALLLLLFPDGHVPSRRWRPVVWTAGIFSLLITVSGAFIPGQLQTENIFAKAQNPIGLPAASPLATIFDFLGLTWFLGLVVLVVAAAAPFARFRKSRGDARLQLKWIATAVLVSAVAALVFELAGGLVSGFPQVSDLVIALGFGCALPVAAGIAIFKHRLYDIDLVISRTLVYGSLAVFITAVYVGIAVGIGALIGGGGKPNLALSIVATAIVAVGFQPVRERVQRVANRLVYGKRATPYEVLSQFSERVAGSYSVDDVMPRMARVLAEGTGAQRADVWLQNGGQWREAAVWPETAVRAASMPAANGRLPDIVGASRLVEVRHQGTLLGALAVTKRTGEALTPVEENLLVHLAGQAGLVLRNVGLTADLQARLDDLRASRQRLVSAQDQERRRLERNLHDGAQQHLVAIKVKLGLAEMLLGRDPEKAKATLAQLKGDADDALENLRDLARGIYPPLLADKGLTVALESQARKATVLVTVEAADIQRYPQEVEAAVYFCCLEALQNVQKYAQASHVVIGLRGDAEQLHFSVTDDGGGFDANTVKKGAGLTNMADRLDALGGTLQLTSHPGSGTTLTATVPVTVLRPVVLSHAAAV